MAKSKNKFTFKIILSYLVLGILAFIVALFLYAEFENYDQNTDERTNKKIIETGTLINLAYQTDGLSRLALLTENDNDFTTYKLKVDTLFKKIEAIKQLASTGLQKKQLDSVKQLLQEKNQNIEQFRILKLTSDEDTSLDDILKEFKKLETTMGKNSLETLVKDPKKLTGNERRFYQAYADYLNKINVGDTTRIRTNTIDSILIASRSIVREAKIENSKIRISLKEKENELIKNDLNISQQLRRIITNFDAEINRDLKRDTAIKQASIKRTRNILKLSAILGGTIILLFTYFILDDFFKAEKFKKSLEEAKDFSEELLKSREQLISTVSHDLKTPVHTITGYSELLEGTAVSEKQLYYINQIFSNAKYINNLVDDLLDYSKLEAKKMPLEAHTFSLQNLVIEVASSIKEIHNTKPIELIIDLDNEIANRFFESDPLRIRQILSNLIGNAFKFTEEGSVAVIGKIIQQKKSKTVVSISVKDSGIGISKEKQSLIFKEFTQADANIPQKFGGNGLGLTISKKLTELLGGKISVESDFGEGSTFNLVLPLSRSNKEPLKTSKQTVQQLQSLNGFIIDDDPSMIALLTEVLDDLNVDSQTFLDFNLAKTTAIKDFDFVLTDIQMPTVNGFEVLAQLRSGVIDSYKAQPVIAMTGSRSHPKSYYLKKGFSKLLTKPFSKEQLTAVLADLFSEKIISQIPIEKAKTTNNECCDISLLRSFIEDEKELQKILLLFVEQTENGLLILNEAFDKKDIGTILETAHRMLTMCRQLKAEKCVENLEELENLPENPQDNVRLKILQEQINDRLNELILFLKNKLDHSSIL